MALKVTSLEQVGDVLLTAFGDDKARIVEQLWDNLMETTPEDTGTLKANWNMHPGGKAGKTFIENTGIGVAERAKPDMTKYIRNWKEFTIFNNSPYIIKVNNGESGNEHNQNFIQEAMAMTKVGL